MYYLNCIYDVIKYWVLVKKFHYHTAKLTKNNLMMKQYREDIAKFRKYSNLAGMHVDKCKQLKSKIDNLWDEMFEKYPFLKRD